jgi:hypothetical protein
MGVADDAVVNGVDECRPIRSCQRSAGIELAISLSPRLGNSRMIARETHHFPPFAESRLNRWS